MPVRLSEDQSAALERLMFWYAKPNGPFMTLGGYAGTGKTTLIAALREELHRTRPNVTVAFVAFTGKASQVLRHTLEDQKAFFDGDSCGTIHALLYNPEFDHNGRLLYWKKSKTVKADLLIVDEASMVTEGVWLDLLSCHKPIIAVGDHGQLPPIEGAFNLMQKPALTLERIHRQVEHHPILRIADLARTEGNIPPGDYGPAVKKYSYATHDASEINDVIDEQLAAWDSDTLILCGRNKTRVQLNKTIRQKFERETDEPEPGEFVVCLKNIYDNARMPIYNGMVGVVERLSPAGEFWYDTEIDFPDENRRFDGRLCRSQFNQPEPVSSVQGLEIKDTGARFDFGYALTVHKAQGSQAGTVVLFEERFQKSDDEAWRRWLYTAVTRARQKLIIIGRE